MHTPRVITGTTETGVLDIARVFCFCPSYLNHLGTRKVPSPPSRLTSSQGASPMALGPSSALGTLGRCLLPGLGPPVPAHGPVLLHVDLRKAKPGSRGSCVIFLSVQPPGLCVRRAVRESARKPMTTHSILTPGIPQPQQCPVRKRRAVPELGGKLSCRSAFYREAKGATWS